MANEVIKRDVNNITLLGAITNNSAQEIVQLRVDSITQRLLVDAEVTPADTPTIYNVSMTSANTEYSQSLPSGTRVLDIKLREGNAQLKISFTENESGTKYITIPYGSSLHLEGVNLTSKTIYFQSPTASQTAEIICWT